MTAMKPNSVSVLPILARPGETFSLKEAAHRARRDEKTIRRWCACSGIGWQAGKGGSWEVHRIGLEMVMHGDFEALERLRSGMRDHVSVARYFDHIGLPLECPNLPDSPNGQAPFGMVE